MKDLMQFRFKANEVRVVVIDDQPWFAANDVCNILDIKNQRDAISGLDDDEKGVATTDTLGGRQEINIINESGLYSLIFRSRKSEAKRFKKWVTSEVLPSIRKTGSYSQQLNKQLIKGLAAAAVKLDLLQSDGVFLSIDHNFNVSVKSAPEDVLVFDPSEKNCISYLVSKALPLECIPEVMQICTDRLAKNLIPRQHQN